MAQTEISTRRVRGRAELIAALGDARDGINQDASDLGDLLNVPKRIRKSLADTPLRRAATALVAGFVSSRILSKKNRGPKAPRTGWRRRLFHDLDFKKLFALFLKSYLEPDQVDLKALLRERLREYLK